MNVLARLSIGLRLSGAFFIVLALLTAVAVFSLNKMGDVNARVVEVNTSWLPSIKLLGDLNTATSDFRLAELQHILSTSEEDMSSYEKQLQKIDATIESSRKEYEKVITSDDERKGYDEFVRLWGDYLQTHQNVIALSRKNRTEEARAMSKGKGQEFFEAACEKLLQLTDLNNEGADKAETASKETYDAARTFIWGLTGLAILLGTTLGFFITRGITGPLLKVMAELLEGSAQVASASSQVSSASQDLSTGSSKSAASLEENSAALEELSSSVRFNAQNTLEAANLSKTAWNQAEDGEKQIARLVDSVNEISQSSKKIEEIIKVIDEIAFQTNLLALNAAVEAARAGDHGKGFAVVAEEVRNLAQRSAGSAKDIAGLITDSVTKSREGLRLADASGEALQTILSSVKKVAELNGEIAKANEEQSRGIQQINKAVTQLDGISQQNAAVAEEAAAAAEELSAQAMTLQSLGAELNRVVAGSNAHVTTVAPPARRSTKRAVAPMASYRHDDHAGDDAFMM